MVGVIGSVDVDDVSSSQAPITFDQPVSGLVEGQPYFLILNLDDIEADSANTIVWHLTIDPRNQHSPEDTQLPLIWESDERGWTYMIDHSTVPPGTPSFYLMMKVEAELPLPGDLNGDGQLNVVDIDAMATALHTGDMDSRFDLNDDGMVTRSDLHFLVTDSDHLNTSIGDSNLDGEFNSADFVQVFQAGEYEDDIDGNSTWSTGDWNVDSEFNSGDFVIAFQDGGFEQGPRPAVRTVPEPHSVIIFFVGGILCRCGGRRRTC